MKELDMHYRNWYDPEGEYIPSFLDENCRNCPFMPDYECGWGFQELDECVFQLNPGTPYWIDIFENGIHYVDKKIQRLTRFLDQVDLLHLKTDDWSFSEKRDEFLGEYRRPLLEIQQEGKTLAQYYSEYWLWFHSNDPCACCGKITKEFVVHGDKRNGDLIKLCETCADAEWTATYRR